MSKKRPRPLRTLPVESLESRSLMAADAGVAWGASNVQSLFAETKSVVLSFDNVGSNVGYGPFVDLVVPTRGDQDAGGLRYVGGSARILDKNLRETVVTFDEAGRATHPLAKDSSGKSLVLQGQPGYQLVVFELPFGSFVADQPNVQVDMQIAIDSNATIGQSLPLIASGGFQFGSDALNNPTKDPSLRGASSTLNIIPNVLTTRLEYLGPEDETATGDNFVRAYRVFVDIAEGAEISNLQAHHLLDSNQAFLGLSESTWTDNELKVIKSPSMGVPSQESELIVGLPYTKGVAGLDGSYVVQFLIPETDASNSSVLDPKRGENATSKFSGRVQGEWRKPPIETNASSTIVQVSSEATPHLLHDKVLATQLSVRSIHDANAKALGPGDTLEYTIDFQISDFASLNHLALVAHIPNGQEWVASVPVSLSLTGIEGFSESKSITSPFGLEGLSALESGATPYAFDVTRELRAIGLSGELHGASTPLGQGIGVTGRVTFQAVVLDQFQWKIPSGDLSIDEHDTFSMLAFANGLTIDNESRETTKNLASDSSNIRLTIASGALQTSVYAINGVRASTTLQASAGDLVTYRIRRMVRSGDIEDLVLSDYLPLPIHKLEQVRWGERGASGFNGLLQLGPDDSFHSIYGSLPSIKLDTSNNRMVLNYRDFDSKANEDTVADLLLTVAIEDSPFADGMWLTNVATAWTGSSNNGSVFQNSLSSIQYARPVLTIVKGVAATDNPNATISPLGSNDANISGVDSGDRVRFRIVVSNSGLGSKGAFDALIKDTLPVGYSIPNSGLELTVTDKFGRPLKYLAEGTGEDKSLFESGLRLVDPILNGRIAGDSNQVVIMYTLELNDLVRANTAITGEASVTHYAAMPRGQNHATEKIADNVTTRIANVAVLHKLISTDQPHTSGSRVVIGETATFQVRVSLPEGKLAAATLQVNLPRGLAIREILDVSVSDRLKLLETTRKDLLANASIVAVSSDPRDGGRQLRFRLGDVENINRDNSTKEYIDVVYTATITNDFDSNAGTVLRSSAVLNHQSGSASSSDSVSVVEPSIDVVRTWNSTRIDALDKVTVSLDVRASSNNGSTAHDVLFSELVTEGVSYVPGSLRWVSGAVKPMSLDDREGVLNVTWNSIAIGQNSRLEYDVIVNSDVHAGATLINRGTIQWSSLQGNPGQISNNNSLSFERTGDTQSPGATANDYRRAIESSVVVNPVQLTMKLVETSQPLTAGSQVTIGEMEVFEIVAIIPEGVHQLSLSGLTTNTGSLLLLESLELISVGKNLSGDLIQPGLRAKLEGATQASMDLGIVKNAGDNFVSEEDRLVFRLVTRVPNEMVNSAGDRAQADVRVDFQYAEVAATSVLNIVEPTLLLTQKVSLLGVDAKDTLEAVIQIQHSENSTSAAVELDLVESIEGTGLAIVPGSIEAINGHILVGNGIGDRSIRIAASELPRGSAVTIKFKLQVSDNVQPGDLFRLPATLKWNSLLGEGSRSYFAQSSTQIRVSSSTLSGSVTVDTNQDGIQQAVDFGIGSVEVRLAGVDHLGNQVLRSLQTDGNGRFSFEGLRPGVYAIAEVQPEYFFDGLDFSGVVNGSVGNDVISEIRLSKGSDGNYSGYRFTESPLTWLSGTVFVDEDENRVLGQAEEGIEGVSVTLSGINELGAQVERTAKTNSRGYYVFDYLEPGTYSIVEGTTPGYFDAWEQLGNRGGTFANDRFDKIHVAASKPGSMYNFGEYKPGTIVGQIYIDYDRDGVLDRKDGLVSNVEVILKGINDLGETVELSSFTDDRGYYRFDSLRPGNYNVQSPSLDGLESSVSNVGRFNGDSSPKDANGVGVMNGFRSIQLPAGGQGNAYNIGHFDPTFDPTLLQNTFDHTMIVNGTNAADTFDIQMTSQGGEVTVNGRAYQFDSRQSLSVRILGSFGTDTLTFTGSENKESVDLRRSSARITGTWFETLIYGMENIEFAGGGNEDLARFYDTAGDDSFQAIPLQASMTGAGYKNVVSDVHRIYAYATTGTDQSTMTGATGQKDDFNASPEEARLDGGYFYLYTSGFDTVRGFATDSLDRAHLFDSKGDDQMTSDEKTTDLSGSSFRITAVGYSNVLASADAGGRDSAVLIGSTGDDRLSSRPLDATFDIRGVQVNAQGFEMLLVQASAGSDVATVYDSHYNDSFTADPSRAWLSNATGDVQMTGFERVTALMEAGGDDTAVLQGSTLVDTFKASPTSWSLMAAGYVLVGSGFTKVTAYGDVNDLAYLYDSAYNDLLELTPRSAVLTGQLFQNEAIGFGKVNAESQGGFDRVLFFDSILRSTVRFTEPKTTIFGTGFSHNATGFDTVDAYYADLNGLDNVELSGRVTHAMIASDVARAKYKLSLRSSATAPLIDLKTRVDRL